MWYPHYIRDQNKDNGIPIFTNPSNLSKYILNRTLRNKETLYNKIQYIENYLREVNLSTDIKKITLNRNIENPYDYYTGAYYQDQFITSDLIEENKKIELIEETDLNSTKFI